MGSLDDAFSNAQSEINNLLSSKAQLQQNVQQYRRHCEQEIANTVSQVDNAVSVKKAEISGELEELQQRKDTMFKCLREFEDIIVLNVGGILHTTTLTTIRKEPGSMLDAMFSGRHELSQDKDGNYFLDRDGELFGVILNYLRSGIIPDDLTQSQIRQLRLEADYFGVQSLLNLLEGGLKNVRHNYAILQYNANFVPSSFLGPIPDGIELFYFQDDCYKSYKEMTEVLADLRERGWNMVLNVPPTAAGGKGRLIFSKEELVKT